MKKLKMGTPAMGITLGAVLVVAGILVMLIERGGQKPIPAVADTVFEPGDRLTVFGNYNAICKAFHAREHLVDD